MIKLIVFFVEYRRRPLECIRTSLWDKRKKKHDKFHIGMQVKKYYVATNKTIDKQRDGHRVAITPNTSLSIKWLTLELCHELVVLVWDLITCTEHPAVWAWNTSSCLVCCVSSLLPSARFLARLSTTYKCIICDNIFWINV